MSSIIINNLPDADELWKGIGGHFDTFSQIICEFLDNSISNFTANNLLSKTIIIGIKELQNNRVLVSIEDSGTGIKNLSSAFTLGSKHSKESPLNEHGFGMKHALASANTENNNWKIYTRDKSDIQNKQLKKIISPYKIIDFTGEIVNLYDEEWPGQLNGTGTYIEFECSEELFKTIRRGIKGKYSFNRTIDIFTEDLGFIYSGLIKENRATITVLYEDLAGNNGNKHVSSIDPDWKNFIDPGQGTEKINLGGGIIDIQYSFGSMNESKNYKYYKRNMSSSGVEIRLNGRVLAYNLFKEVWGVERHNKYNYLLVQLDLISNDSNALPPTRTSKNGLREGDEKLEKLYEWIRSYLSKPIGEIEESDDEKDLFEELERLKIAHLPKPNKITREHNVYINIKEKVGIDLYIKIGDQVIIYEGKKDKTTIKDVYQLKMYWDGCVLDGIQPTKGILISAKHPDSVEKLIEYVNQMQDLNDHNYNFELKKWWDEQVKYPPFNSK